MAKLKGKALKEYEAKRDLGAELIESVRQMNEGKIGRVYRISISAVTEARNRVGLSQAQFAKILGVSARTLQEWEQGRRKPSGAAQTLLAIAARHPEVLKDVLAA